MNTFALANDAHGSLASASGLTDKNCASGQSPNSVSLIPEGLGADFFFKKPSNKTSQRGRISKL